MSRLLILLLLTACGNGSSTASGPAVRTDTINGVVHVESSGDLAAAAMTHVVSMGSADDGPAAFGRIRSLTADSAGNIYVADNLAHEIRVFDATGNHVRTIGRQGGGPGEFGDLYSLAWIGGNLAAMDPRNARIAVLTPEGQWVDGIRHYPITGPASLVRLHPLGADGFYTPIIGERGSIPFVRHTRAGAADTILAPRAPPGSSSGSILCHHADGGITGISVPEGPATVYAFAPPGGVLAVAWSAHYRIALIDVNGDTTRVIQRATPTVAYTDSLWRRAIAPYDEMMAEYPGTKCEPASLERPASRAALRHILFDDNGDMWVEAATEAGFAWDVFDAQGRLRARHSAPPRSTGVPPFVRAGYLYQVEADSLGVQRVAVYRTASDAR